MNSMYEGLGQVVDYPLHFTSNSIQFNPLHFNSIHFRFNPLNFNPLNFNPLNFNPLHFNSLNFNSLNFTSLQFTSLQIHFSPLHFTSIHFDPLHFTSLQSTSILFNSIHFKFNSIHFTSLHFTWLTSLDFFWLDHTSLWITQPKNHLFALFFLILGCPKHSLYAHIGFPWLGGVWCTSEIRARYSSMVCHASRDLATSWPNKPLFLPHEGKVWAGNHNNCFDLLEISNFVALEGWPRDTILVQYAFCIGMTGFSWSDPLMYLPRQNVLTWDSLARQLGSVGLVFASGLCKSSTLLVLAVGGECGLLADG
jgi:hypothetical protein